MRVADVKTRIEAEVAALAGRVREAADLAELVARKALPQTTPAAFVLPLGLRPRGEGDAAAGAFTQMLDEIVSVVLAVRGSGDATGAKALPSVDTLISAIVGAVAGWAPGGEIGVFRLVKGDLVSVNAGLVVYQLDFAIQDQIRIV